MASEPSRGFSNWNASHHFVLAAPEYFARKEWGWWGPIAINHGDSSVVGFCDGHSEVRLWRDNFTIDWVNKLITQGGGNYGQGYPPEEQRSDIDDRARGWAFRQKLPPVPGILVGPMSTDKSEVSLGKRVVLSNRMVTPDLRQT